MIAPWGSLLFGLAGIRSAPIILDALILGPDSSPGEPGSHMCSVACGLLATEFQEKLHTQGSPHSGVEPSLHYRSLGQGKASIISPE